jgi:glycogen synthase
MNNMIHQAMLEDFSWENSAESYLSLYQHAIDVKPK